MTVYSFYIYNPHCTLIYFSSFLPGPPPRLGPSTLPNVFRPSASSSSSIGAPTTSTTTIIPPWEKDREKDREGDEESEKEKEGKERKTGLALDEEAKLVYGIVLSLRNMVKKLSGRDDDSFYSFSTSHYKLHHFLTPTSTHFILLTSPTTESYRTILRQVYTGPWNEFVVRNPLVMIDSGREGKGVDNDGFRAAVDKLLGSA